MPKKKDKSKQEHEAVQEAIKQARAEKNVVRYEVYAPFQEFSVGQEWQIPEGWKQDPEYQQLIMMKTKRREGLVFIRPDGNRVVLPLKEK